MTFKNDDEHREYFLGILWEKLKYSYTPILHISVNGHGKALTALSHFVFVAGNAENQGIGLRNGNLYTELS